MVMIIPCSMSYVKSLVFSSLHIELPEGGDETGEAVSPDRAVAESVPARVMGRVGVGEGGEHKARDDRGQGGNS